MSKTVCIYHGNCMDGFTAAWVVRKWWDKQLHHPVDDSIEFIAGVYQRPVNLEQLRGNNVIIVDFSYKPETMYAIYQAASHLTWLDHHKSAILAMEDSAYDFENLDKVTDNGRSGAGIVWDYYFSNEPRPKLVEFVEDRDLWKFKHFDSRNFNAFMFSHDYDFGLWDELAEKAEDKAMLAVMCAAGAAIERKHFKDINELLPICTRHIRIAGYIIPVANLPYTMVADAGNILAKRNPSLFGSCYYDGMDGRNFSLRSVEGGLDVSEIAAQFGGGGHARAAGFRVDFEAAREFEVVDVQVGDNFLIEKLA